MRRIRSGLLIVLAIGITAAVVAPVPAQAPPRDVPARLGELGIAPVKAVPAPDFSLAALDGTRLALADLKGRPALLYFWASW